MVFVDSFVDDFTHFCNTFRKKWKINGICGLIRGRKTPFLERIPGFVS